MRRGVRGQHGNQGSSVPDGSQDNGIAIVRLGRVGKVEGGRGKGEGRRLKAEGEK